MAFSPQDPNMSLSEVLSRLRTREPVLLADGPPLSGMTRSMWENVRQARPDARLVNRPALDIAAAAYSGAFEELSPFDTYIVWLDDLSPADLILLDDEALDIITTRAIVLANINTFWCTRLTNDTSEMTAGARKTILERAERTTVPFALTPGERQRAQEAFPDLALGVSLAESLVGGDILLRHFDQGTNNCPDGHALVQAAVDARHAGIHRGLTDTELRDIFPAPGRGLVKHRPNDETFAKALAWATTPPPGASLPLLTQRAGGRTALNYLAGAQDGMLGGPASPTPHSRWAILIDRLPRSDAFNIGVAAHLRGLPDIAEAAFRAAVKCGDPIIYAAAKTALSRMST